MVVAFAIGGNSTSCFAEMAAERLDFSSLLGAVTRLEEAFGTEPGNGLERDGCIQRFEYTCELCWKLVRRQLMLMDAGDADLLGRKELFREAARCGLIDDPEGWFAVQKARNMTNYNYDEDMADKAYATAKEFLPQARWELQELMERNA